MKELGNIIKNIADSNKEIAGLYVNFDPKLTSGSTCFDVAGVDISFDTLKSLILSTKVYDTGNAFLLSNDFDFLVDKNKTNEDNLVTMNNGIYKYITDEMNNKKSSIIEADYEEKQTLMSYYRMDNDQIVGVSVPESKYAYIYYHFSDTYRRSNIHINCTLYWQKNI